MAPPRYRTLDGDEVELPLPTWYRGRAAIADFLPRGPLAMRRSPMGPRLNFSGALLVPVERWNEHAALEPNLAPCRISAPMTAPIVTALAPPGPSAAPGAEDDEVFEMSVAGMIGTAATVCLAALAVGYVVGVTVWLWSLRHRVARPDVSRVSCSPVRRSCSPGSPGQ